jgi:signal transduction histidine kinase/CHASE2 domain-containing sensor protein
MSLWNNWKPSLLLGGFLLLVLLILWNANAFAQLRLTLSNAYFVPIETSDSIVIVSLDDKSLAAYGRTPAEWSRTLFGDLAEIVADNGARVLAYDLIFSESTPDDEIFAESLLVARQSDARTRIILSAAGVQVPITELATENYPNGLHYSASLEPNPTLKSVADYIGYVNAFPDVDGRLRRQPSIVEIDDKLGFSFNLSVLFAQRSIPSNIIEQVITADDANLHLPGELALPVDSRGLWLQNYFGTPYVPASNTVFPVVSFRDVIEGDLDASIFNDKIILVGLIDSLGATDQYLVPSSTSGALMSGVEIQANAIQTLLSGIPLNSQSSVSQVLMIVSLTIFSSILFNKPRWYWKLLLWFGVMLIFFVVVFFIFTSQHQVINLFYGSLAISLPALLTVGLEISREITSRRRTEFLLTSVVTIAEQNLVMDNILPLIADDVQALISDSGGFIWVYSSGNRTTPKEYRWRIPIADQSLSTLAHKAVKNLSTQNTGKQIVVPILWQGELQGVIAIQSNRQIGLSQVTLIEDLAQRLAPTIDNITLHHSIDRQNRLLELILGSSPASIVVVDHALKILQSNDRFNQWMTTDTDDILSSELLSLFRQREISDETLTEFQHQLDVGQSFELQLRDNQQHILRLSAVRLTELGHWVMILVDVTDLVQLNELKTQMIRMASHDLKNPLSRVLGYAELILSSDVLDDMNEQFMDNIMNAGDEINKIITDILDLEQLRSGQVERTPASFKNLVREIVSRHEPDKDRKQQTMTLDMPDVPITVSGDYLRLGQAVSNLVSNAIKYTPEQGDIKVRIWQPEPTSVQLEIEDNGYGIPERSQAKLFTEFYRVKSKETRSISGTGLGLSLVKSVIENHEGEVWVKSVEGEGSTFYILLPVIIPDMEIDI